MDACIILFLSVTYSEFGDAIATENTSVNSLICKSDQWRCPNITRCIQKDFLCDGEDDCGDGTDEKVASCHSTTTMGPMSAAPVAQVQNVYGETCGPNRFQCLQPSWRCVALEFVCDGDNDCDDGSDENAEACRMTEGPVSTVNMSSTQGTSSCDGGEFECTDGECIYAFFICDGENDCTDSSDESPSICAALGATDSTTTSTTDCKLRSGFLCGDGGSCILQEELCDGKADCSDGSDEDTARCDAATTSTLTSKTSAGPLLCSVNEFKCTSGLKCVPMENKCDEKDDCGDGSDEANHKCDHKRNNPDVLEDSLSSSKSNRFAIFGGFIVFVSLVALGAIISCRRRRMLLEHVSPVSNNAINGHYDEALKV